MDIYSAIMKAADHIEQHPELFNFDNVRIPECGTPGCALGWIGHFLGIRIGEVINRVASHPNLRAAPIPVDELVFYQRMDGIERKASGVNWMINPVACARYMRVYADKYHKPATPALDPAFIAFRDKFALEFA